MPVAVLEGGIRVLTSKAMLTSLGRPWKGSYKRTSLPNFIEANNIIHYINNDLQSVLTPIAQRAEMRVILRLGSA